MESEAGASDDVVLRVAIVSIRQQQLILSCCVLIFAVD
jgi:hypothetical protein